MDVKQATLKRGSKFYDEYPCCRMRDRIHELGKTYNEIADIMKRAGMESVSAEAVRQWCGGYARPDIGKMKDIAAVLECSTDYLFGLTDIRTANADIKAICEYTGLSEKAVITLGCLNSWEYDSQINTINILIEQEELSVMETTPEMICGWRELTKEEILQYTAEELQKIQKRTEDHDYFCVAQKEWESRPHVRIISKISDFFNAKTNDKKYYFDSNGDVISEAEYASNPWFGAISEVISKELIFTAYTNAIQERLIKAKETYFSGESYLAKMRRKTANTEIDEIASKQDGEPNAEE